MSQHRMSCPRNLHNTLLPLSQCLQDGSAEAQRQHAQSAPPEAQQQPAQQQQQPPRGEGGSPTASADEEGAGPRQQAQVHVPGQVHVTLKVRARADDEPPVLHPCSSSEFGQQESGGDGAVANAVLRMLCCVRAAAHAGFCPIFWHLLDTCQSCKPLCKCRGIQAAPTL